VTNRMSVETETSHIPESSISNATNAKGVTVEKQVVKEAKEKTIPSSGDGINDSITAEKSYSSQIRTWFESLSADELSAVMSFSDKAFLETFLDLSSWSDSDRVPYLREKHGSPSDVGSRQIQWEKLVPWKAVETSLSMCKLWVEEVENDSALSMPSASKTETEGPADASLSLAESGGTGRVAEEIGEIFLEESSSILEVEDECVGGEGIIDIQPFLSLLDRTCVIYSSAIRYVSEREREGKESPFVTVHPSHFEALQGSQLLSVLDTAASSMSEPFFLSKSVYDKAPWQHRFGTKKALKFPLWGLFLARFEKSVYNAFSKHTRQKSFHANEALNADFPLRDVFSHARLLGEKSVEIDVKTLEKVMLPLHLVYFGEDRPRSCTLENLMFLPLNWLVYAKSTCRKVNFLSGDVAVQCCLERVKEHSGLENVSFGNVGAEFEVTTPREGGQSQGTVLKKRRRRRVNRKKNSNETSIGPIGGEKRLTTVETECAPVETPLTELSTSLEAAVVPKGLVCELSVATDEISAQSDRSAVKQAEQSNVDDGSREITISRVQGTYVVASTPNMENIEQVNLSDDRKGDDGDSWEKVEVRGRANRKKAFERPHHGQLRGSHRGCASHSMHGHIDGSKKAKISRSSGARRRNTNRKVARDILYKVLDSVEDQVKNRGEEKPPLPSSNPWKTVHSVGRTPGVSTPCSQKGAQKHVTMRDVVLGKSVRKSTIKSSLSSFEASPSGTNALKESMKVQNSLVSSQQRMVDQNTAPTYQETVSAVSGNTHDLLPQKTSIFKTKKHDPKSDCISDNSEAPQNRAGETSPSNEKNIALSPPLPTLLNPESGNSSTSSVSSSLEVPHASHCHHHSTTAVDVNDVGYHLLDVCDRLSQDMRLFMSRRSQALNARRKERVALLGALQNSVAKLWPASCHVELYGSCATHLDLPSSDLDVVVVGLDRRRGTLMQVGTQNNGCLDGKMESKSDFDVDDVRQKILNASLPPYIPTSTSLNAERIKRLAAELATQPWAVQVKAIPTASVPVVKVLADPYRLQNVSGNDWKLDKHPKIAAETSKVSQVSSDSARLQSFQPWRGADAMNGLLSFDITFEGPEHGGIGSTEFSIRTVNEACRETGLPPEGTPFVQVIMVLKELLAQRKLNEPYSGGLSSYALLLLVVSLLRERTVIREELDRVEQQRQAVAADTMDTQFSRMGHDRTAPACAKSQQVTKTSNIQRMKKVAEGDIGKQQVSSTWASIAKSEANDSDLATNKVSGIWNSRQKRHSSFADVMLRPASQCKASNRSSTHMNDVAKNFDALHEATSECEKDGTGNREHMPDVLPADSSHVSTAPSFFQQGYNDVVDVLCSGNTTAGKLLMHFLLFYGHHFEAQKTAIDVSGTHARDITGRYLSYFSPFIPRGALGSIDPITGMLTVDPVIVYDPLEGAENNNVARRCFAWNSIRWIFAQSYATLSSAVERSTNPPTCPNSGATPTPVADMTVLADSSRGFIDRAEGRTEGTVDVDLMDPSSPLLRCLLSF
jgi:hypothetical protein